MVAHPELESEQEYIRRAYECLDEMRASARVLQYSVESGAGGTHQARFERDVVEEQALVRLSRLQLGSESLVFGRIDVLGENGPGTGERFYIGRLPVSDREQNPVVVDWRAPVAESFYRATGRNPLGLERRRHFATDGEQLLGIDDEVFTVERLEQEDGSGLVGTGALLAALGRARTGHMRDIVATIQAEQDQIIRAEMPGVLVVQGGPGTGKTAVALHRASYLLYTHRFPLERQGVLVVGPNRMFMRYISRVLPALGETGVELSTIDDLVADSPVRGVETHAAARVKGELRMTKFIRKAVHTRQRALRDDLKVGVGVVDLTVTADETHDMVATVKRGHRAHNAARKQLQNLLIDRLYQRYLVAMARLGRTTPGEGGVLGPKDFAAMARRLEAVKLALDRMWPLLTPQMLLHDLFGAPALVKAAARDILSEEEQRLLHRPRSESVDEVAWTSSDMPLLDEAAQFLGPLPKQAVNALVAQHAHDPGRLHGHAGHGQEQHAANVAAGFDDGIRTYGHIVVDEAQDLSPMQLRMLVRRSLSGSMTVVGDIAQATGMWAPDTWDEILAHLPDKRPPRKIQLTVGYRTPAEIMAVAAGVLAEAAPELVVPTSVRSAGFLPTVVEGAPDAPLSSLVLAALGDLQSRGEGTIGVLCPDALVAQVARDLEAAGVTLDPSGAVGDGISVLPVSTCKGLEFDGVLVVEPARIVREAAQGLRALYVALTRATRALAVVHREPLPGCLAAAEMDRRPVVDR